MLFVDFDLLNTNTKIIKKLVAFGEHFESTNIV